MAKDRRPARPRDDDFGGNKDLRQRWGAGSPEYRRRAREIEYETQRFVERYRAAGLKTGVVRIPVVVHVVHNSAQNDFQLPQVQQQIAALNRDFRLQNPLPSWLPPSFAAAAADTRIEFALAVRDPNCNATNGMTSTPTTSNGYLTSQTYQVIQLAPGWPSDRYLNMWVAPLVQDPGYGTDPSYLMSINDGVMVTSDRFGVDPTHTNWELGRTATLMVGLYLNLLHIWGSTGVNCSDDMCADTPLHYLPNYGAPSFPHYSFPSNSICPPQPDGDMFMNFMDSHSVVDTSKFMFTADQALRMHACLAGPRATLLASDSLVPPNAPTTPDLWIQGAADDGGEEPFAGSAPIYCSDDIWVRNGTDGLTYQDHQNPIAEQLNTVYVRVRNRGCPNAGTQNGTVRLYWAKASPSLSWPPPWDGSVTIPGYVSTLPEPMGGEIIPAQSASPAGGATQIVSFPWIPPDPSEYAAFGADQAHFCLLARVETGAGPTFGMTFPETSNFVANVANNNNIAWKNVSIVDQDGPLQKAAVVVGQFDRQRRVARYAFEIPKGPGPTLFDWGFLLVEFRGEALAPWRGRLRGEGFHQLDDGRLLILKPDAWFAAPRLKQGQFGTFHLRFIQNEGPRLGSRVLELDLTERDGEGQLLGAQRFALRTGTPRGRPRDDRVATFDGVDWLPAKGGCLCP